MLEGKHLGQGQTVGELISLLEKYPKDTPVRVDPFKNAFEVFETKNTKTEKFVFLQIDEYDIGEDDV